MTIHELGMKADIQPTQDPYAQLSPDDQEIMQNRFPSLGQPVGKGVEGSTPILLAKLSLDQEIEVVCKAYKVSFCCALCKSGV